MESDRLLCRNDWGRLVVTMFAERTYLFASITVRGRYLQRARGVRSCNKIYRAVGSSAPWMCISRGLVLVNNTAGRDGGRYKLRTWSRRGESASELARTMEPTMPGAARLCVVCRVLWKKCKRNVCSVRFGRVEIQGERTDADKFAIDNPINSPSSLVQARDKSMRCRRHVSVFSLIVPLLAKLFPPLARCQSTEALLFRECFFDAKCLFFKSFVFHFTTE